MEIVEIVKVKNCAGNHELTHVIFDAARGDYADDVNSRDQKKIDEVNKLIRDAIDDFAQYCFDRGREYERQNK